MVSSVFVNPNGIVDKEEDLTDPCDKSSGVGCNFILNEDEEEE